MISTENPLQQTNTAHIAFSLNHAAILADEKITGCSSVLSMPEAETFDPEITWQSYGNDCLASAITFKPVELSNKATGCFSADTIEDDSFTAKLDNVLFESI